jgi:hypothetical protein
VAALAAASVEPAAGTVVELAAAIVEPAADTAVDLAAVLATAAAGRTDLSAVDPAVGRAY